MDMRKWEPTVDQIVAESRQHKNESGRHKVLVAWRAKLEKEPTLLKPFQVDEVVRAVRYRLDRAPE